ncbi:MAG: hypothetical protein JXR76_08380 [Deltaproteobacteria bacterium]|nr:hypothetical protein [Deltaproteobacteria bacterium]
MKRMLFFKMVWILAASMIISCEGTGNQDSSEKDLAAFATMGKGVAALRVQAAGLSIADIARVEVSVNGDYISPDITATLSKNTGGEWTGIVNDIPAGEGRTFTVGAYDSSDALLYDGAASGVVIVDGATASVTVFLQPSISPDPFFNAVPRFTSLSLSASQIAPGHTVWMSAEAADPDGDVLASSWSSSGGSFGTSDNWNTTWTAPTTPGNYEITVAVADTSGATATISFSVDVQVHYGSGSATVNLNINNWPEIANLVPSLTRINVGESTSLELTAADPDRDPLAFTWTSDCIGVFSDATLEDPIFTLTNDNDGLDCTIAVSVTDGRGGSNQASVAIQTGDAVAPVIVPETGWTTLAPMPVKASAFSYIRYMDSVYIIGGGLDNEGSNTSTNVQKYHIPTNTWETDINHGGSLAPLPAPRAFGLNSGVINDRIHTVGGWDEGGTYQNTHFIYDPSNNTWSSGVPLPNYPIGQFSAVVDNAFYVMGGWWGSFQSTVLKYTDVDGWTEVSAMATARNHATTAVVGGKIYVIGGEAANIPQVDTVEVYDPQSDSWTTGLAPLPTPQSYLGWCGSPVLNGRIYLVTSYRYDPALDIWTESFPPVPGGVVAAIEWLGSIYAFGGDLTIGGTPM